MLARKEVANPRVEAELEEQFLPVDFAGVRNLQVEENWRLIQGLLPESIGPNFGSELRHVYALDHETLVGVGMVPNRDKVVKGTPYSVAVRPDRDSFDKLMATIDQKGRCEMLHGYMHQQIEKVGFFAHGFLGSRLAMTPMQERMLQQVGEPNLALFSLSLKGAEGTTQPYPDTRTQDMLGSVVKQLHTAVIGINEKFGFDDERVKAMIGHSYGGLVMFRHLKEYGRRYKNVKYGLVTPLIMGSQSKGSSPPWLVEAINNDKKLRDTHVYILDNSPYGLLVKFAAGLQESEFREFVLDTGDNIGLIPHVLRHFIGMEGLGGNALLPVYLRSLRDAQYANLDLQRLQYAPYIMGQDTQNLIRNEVFPPVVVVAGGEKDREAGDKTLASKHMGAFVKALESDLGERPEIISSDASPHHPTKELVDQLTHRLFA